MSDFKQGPLFEMEAGAKNQRLCADQCEKSAHESMQRRLEHIRKAEEYERASEKLKAEGFK